MTVEELITKLSEFEPKADVVIREENDECDVCSNLKHEQCSLTGPFDWDCIDVKLDRSQVVISGF